MSSHKTGSARRAVRLAFSLGLSIAALPLALLAGPARAADASCTGADGKPVDPQGCSTLLM
jgi:hypothetical protein